MRRILSILSLIALPALAKEIRVESFGADKTGSTDSLAAFDAAVDAASAGDTIVVDGGTFSLSGKWVIDKSLTIRGSGTITEATVLAPVIEVTADKVRILDITIDGTENAASWNTVEATIKARAGIFVNAADDVLIQRVRVQDKSTGISLAGSLRTTVRDVLWQGIDLSTTPVNFAFSSGLYVASGFDILIDGGTWTLGGRGIQLAGALTARVNLRGPTVYSTQSNGVYVNGPSGLQWVGGYITTTVGSAVMLQDVDTATISGIYARSTGTTSLELGTGTLLGVNVTDCDLDEVLSGAGTYTDVILSGGRIDELDWDGGATYSGFVVSDCVLTTIETPIPSGVVLRGNHGDPSEDRVGVGAVDPKVKLDVADDSIRIRNKTTATPPTTGNQGEVVWGDASLSVFTATDTAKTVSYDRVFDVLTYGAIGNGVADDTAAIQVAIDAAELVGGTVVFPAGTYVSNTSLANDQPIRIMGYGATLTVSANYATQTAMLRINGAGTEMYGLTIDGNDQVMRGLSIDPPSGGRVKIRDVTITNITAPVGSANTATGIQLGDEFDYIEILNCRIDGVDGRNTGDDVARGINAVGTGSGGGSLLVQGCWIGNITVNYEGVNDADGISINNTSATDPAMTVKIIGNQFWNCDKRACKIFNPRSIIQGNSVMLDRTPVSQQMYAVFSAYGADVTIDGNDFYSVGNQGNYAQRFVDMSVAVGLEGSRLVVTSNRFRNSVSGSYASGEARAIEFQGNTTNYAEDLIVSGNQFYGLKFGLYMNANSDKIRRMVVTGNSFSGLTNRGIQAFSGSDIYELIFSNNIIETDIGSSVGILDLSIINNATVIGNRITSGTPATVFVGNPAGTLVTYGNTINGDLTGPEAISADNGDAAATLDAHADAWTQRWDTTLTADRAVTLGTGWKGAKFRVVRTAGGAFSLNVGTGPLKALAADEWCEVTYDGSAWFLSAYGSL